MRWKKVDPLQSVDALLLTGSEAAANLTAAMEGKTAFQKSLPFGLGEGWAAVFAQAFPGESEAMVPSIEGAISLFEARPGWYFPVGCDLAVPGDLVGDLLARLASEAGLRPPAIVVPRFEDGHAASSAVDIYPVQLQRHEAAPS